MGFWERFEEAEQFNIKSLNIALNSTLQNDMLVLSNLEEAVFLWAKTSQYENSATLIGAIGSLRESISLPYPLRIQEELTEVQSLLKEKIGNQYKKFRDMGRKMSLDDAVEFRLSHIISMA